MYRLSTYFHNLRNKFVDPKSRHFESTMGFQWKAPHGQLSFQLVIHFLNFETEENTEIISIFSVFLVLIRTVSEFLSVRNKIF